MIYGYDEKTINQYGLKQMREISLSVSADTLREISAHLLSVANELESAETSNWHKHLPSELRNKTGCDVIVIPPQDSEEQRVDEQSGHPDSSE